MKKSLKILLIICSIVLILVLAAWVYFYYFFNLLGECGQNMVKEAPSQNDQHLARLLIVNCGATTDYATWITVKTHSTTKEEQIITLKGDHSKSCTINWIDDNSLSIKCDVDSSELYVHKTEYDGIKINYETLH
jgi:hypothetical protein